MGYKSTRYKIFYAGTIIFLIFLALVCLLPMLHVLAVSFSDPDYVIRGQVSLIPKGFTLETYKIILGMPTLVRGFSNSLFRVIVGVTVNVLLMLLTAYPLSKYDNELPGRSIYVWFLMIPTLFSGGLIPTYLSIKSLNLLDNFWVLILPMALPILNCIMVMNYMRGIPHEIIEASQIDGANELQVLFKIVLPMSVPVIATVGMFSLIDHWNAWFDATLYLSNPFQWPIQSVLRSVLTTTRMDTSMLGKSTEMLKYLNQTTLSSAFIILVSLPIVCIYPFLQKFFVKGIVMGSVKG